MDLMHRIDSDANPGLLASELDFYGRYHWCLNPHLSMEQAVSYLASEIDTFPETKEPWQLEELATNVYMLSCGVLNALDEAIRGPALRLPRKLAARGVGRRAVSFSEFVVRATQVGWLARATDWKEQLQRGLLQFLRVILHDRAHDRNHLTCAVAGLRAALVLRLPPGIGGLFIGVPSPFRRLDLTPHDVIALGSRFAAGCPNRSQPLLLVGVRTSGSYFVPLVRACLELDGYISVSGMTIHPDKGPSHSERKALTSCARAGFTALVLDDSPHTGDTIVQALDIARRAGFQPDRLRALVPLNSTNRNGMGALNDKFLVALTPEEWWKRSLLNPSAVEARLAEYYSAQGFSSVRVVPSRRADDINSELERRSSGYRHSRLKRVYAVELWTGRNEVEARHVLVKSVGWGWLGYHAFLCGQRLRGYVPPVLGLREGMLYSEWLLPKSIVQSSDYERAALIDANASYIAERTRHLRLESAPIERTRLNAHENGLKLIARTLSRAYGRHVGHFLARPAIERALAGLPCLVPTLIDGKMDPCEWLFCSGRFLKMDFEHHGMGKAEINTCDPAFDLATTVLTLGLSQEEEARLLQCYSQLSGDNLVSERLFLNKLLAGLWTMQSALEQLFGKAQPFRLQSQYHATFLRAWNFLTVEAARFCGSQWLGRSQPHWRAPLIVLDIDGVIDRRTLGFPCTTAAGIRALSELRGQSQTVVLNTARSAAEVQHYCQAYSLAGGIAEHGAYLWNAVTAERRILIEDEAVRQLDRLRAHLRSLPSVFLDDRHRYSIRAFTYVNGPGTSAGSLQSLISPPAGVTSPLPKLLMNHCVSELGLDRLAFHQTTIDTMIHAKDHDKGTGLVALRDWVGLPHVETIAIGDSAPDLPMFRVATRSFAPAHIPCRREARLLGCQIAQQPYQRGLLEIVLSLTGRKVRPQATIETGPQRNKDVFVAALQAADEASPRHLLRALVSTRSIAALIR